METRDLSLRVIQSPAPAFYNLAEALPDGINILGVLRRPKFYDGVFWSGVQKLDKVRSFFDLLTIVRGIMRRQNHTAHTLWDKSSTPVREDVA